RSSVVERSVAARTEQSGFHRPRCRKLLGVRELTGAVAIQKSGRRAAALFDSILYCSRCDGVSVAIHPQDREPVRGDLLLP
ncbi:MAG TPA: hypothetical protein VKA53_07190, partial [Thermoanaerobaculia bacterium]|nr:hypothetical protein [Thermoanaerobaculia bacterium]